MIRIKIEEKNLSFFQKLRIYQFYFARKFCGIKIVFFDELNTFNSPYVLANNFNKEEIKNITFIADFFQLTYNWILLFYIIMYIKKIAFHFLWN